MPLWKWIISTILFQPCLLPVLYFKNAPEYFIVVDRGSIYGEIQRVEKSRLLYSVRYAIICARAAVLQGGSLPHFTEDGR